MHVSPALVIAKQAGLFKPKVSQVVFLSTTKISQL